jgi:hypothetical protein
MKTIVKDRPPRLSRQFLRDQQWVFDHMPELKEKYPDQWILVHKGQVIASGEEAQRLANGRTGSDQLLHFVEKHLCLLKFGFFGKRIGIQGTCKVESTFALSDFMPTFVSENLTVGHNLSKRLWTPAAR